MKKEYLFAGLTILLWSTVAAISKLLLGTLDKFQLLWASSFFAGVFLLAVNLITGRIRKYQTYRPKDYVLSALIGLPGTFFYYVFYYAGTDLLPASQAFIINYMWLIMSIFFACLILKEKMTLQKGIAVAVSFIGVIIVTGGVGKWEQDALLGAVLCIAGAVSYGLFTALNQKFHYDKLLSMMINYSVTFLLTSVINLANGNLFIPTAVQLLGFAWNGMFAIATAGTLWMLALESGKTAKISNLAYITPFLSLVWTSLILKEELKINSVLGLIVIVLGILIQLKRPTLKECKE